MLQTNPSLQTMAGIFSPLKHPELNMESITFVIKYVQYIPVYSSILPCTHMSNSIFMFINIYTTLTIIIISTQSSHHIHHSHLLIIITSLHHLHLIVTLISPSSLPLLMCLIALINSTWITWKLIMMLNSNCCIVFIIIVHHYKD